MIITPIEAQDSDHVIDEAGLKFIANRSVVVTAGAYDSEYMLCQIGFARRDGSIMVHTPYLDTVGGVLAAVSIPPEVEPGAPITYSCAEGGKATRHHVKFSHHPDGRVHFSQDAKVRTEIRRRSFPLAGTIGKVFELHAYLLSGFEKYDHFGRNLKRGYVRTRFTDTLPRAVVVSAEWRTKQSMRDNINPPGDSVGPSVHVQHRRNGERFKAFWVGQPPGFPFQDHVLMVSVTPTKSLEEIAEPTMIFQGGWDPHETKEGDPPVRQTGFLSALYPARDVREFESRLGSIDLAFPEIS